MKVSNVTYSCRLARIMRQRGYSVRRLALEARVDRAGIRRIRSGITQPSWSVACRMADALGCKLDDLVGRKRRQINTTIRPDGGIASEEAAETST